MTAPGWGRVAAAVAMRPGLWPTAVVQALRLAPSGWWRRWPPLPRPDPNWMAFRLRTAYGDADRAPEPDDVVAWLYWCRRSARLRYPRRP